MSAWLLSDGRLSARAIRNTLRWRDTQPWLVYASACEAGMDGGDTAPVYQSDVFGLASAFLDHGVSAFIGPLWRIDDQVASEIAVAFYQQLLKERQTIGEALRFAKAQAKAKPSTPRAMSWRGTGLNRATRRSRGRVWCCRQFDRDVRATDWRTSAPEPNNVRPMDEGRID